MQDDEVGLSVAPPEPGDIIEITAIARDYIEGWLDGDKERMRRCLHPDLVKRTIYHEPERDDWRLGRPADAAMMVDWTGRGNGQTAVAQERLFEITIEDVFRHIASVKVLSHPYWITSTSRRSATDG